MQPRINQIQLPIEAYDAFMDLQARILSYDVDPETANFEAIEILKHHWDHQPEPWEQTEIVLKSTATSLRPK